MFADEADRRAAPFRFASLGVVTGSVLLAAAAAAIISPRTIPFFLLGLVAACGVFAVADKNRTWPAHGSSEAAMTAFLAWAAVTAFWSLDPTRALTQIGIALAVFFGAGVAARVLWEADRGVAVRLAEGLWLGFAIGLLYLFVEAVSGQAIKIWLYNLLGLGPGDLKPNWFQFENGRLVRILDVDLTRNAAPAALLLWPSIVAALGAVEARFRLAVAFGLGGFAAAAVFLSPHEASKVALVAGAAAFVSSRLSAAWTWRGLAAAWVAVCLSIVPASLLAHRLDLHNAPWLQPSAQHRVIIWNYTAEETLKSPLFGAGALTTYVTGQFVKPDVQSLPDETKPRTLSQHAHNVFLQTWYEMGVAGALLLALAGAVLIATLWRLPARVQPFAAATFASAFVMLGSSYGLWQSWFLAMFGLAAVAFAAGARAYATRRGPERAYGADATA